MSGGVDSSVAAAVLLRQGCDVIGCFMRLGTVGESLESPEHAAACRSDGAAPAPTGGHAAPPSIKHRGCCSVSDAADARLVAAQLGIPFYVCNFKKDFGRIIEYFADEYAAGRTPNPCVRCNDWLKFGKLHDYAADLGCDYVASGHYARIITDAATGQPRLAMGLDEAKDQSYVLFGVDREKLRRMLLPIGEMRKAEVRALASELGLPVFDKPDSQEICFVPDDDYAGLVERRRPDLAGSRGAIVDTAGRAVGEHQGQHRFTIGQRRRIGVALGRPLYVVEKRPESNTIVVGDEHDLLVESCAVGEVNWLAASLPDAREWMHAHARYRSNGRLVVAEFRALPAGEPGPSGRTGHMLVRFAEPQPSVAPGQALVLYDDSGRVLGGGWIASVNRASATND
jgi:tRNA-specific 2-thiouridylase